MSAGLPRNAYSRDSLHCRTTPQTFRVDSTLTLLRSIKVPALLPPSLPLIQPRSHPTLPRHLTMIRFDSLPPEVVQAMCTPMHQILAPALVHGITTGALYLGSLSAATDKDLLRQHHITHVVHVLGDGYWFPSNPGESGGVWKDGFCSYRIDILDDCTEDLGRHLERVCGFIDSSLRSGRNLLVHCHQVNNHHPFFLRPILTSPLHSPGYIP